jgi:hypothetical protein
MFNLLKTAQKYRNLPRDPCVALSIVDPLSMLPAFEKKGTHCPV